MTKEFHALTVEEIERSIEQLKGENLLLEEAVCIAEENVLRCRFWEGVSTSRLILHMVRRSIRLIRFPAGKSMKFQI
ncbi:hypothetical protein GFK26_20165 [Variovorax paradoxus]|uniref:Uncharacterized protein n=1 Tax=Variovorax paradoxus TaxID=34073 RepID=A0A5Q0M5Z0_VARPD|nr:hypothetical protein [Variovorax paradoxus]QFZ84909.1 hypothetical protein GFK26_20165 [Variovorax paradoxus]